jgi:ribosomal protein L32
MENNDTQNHRMEALEWWRQLTRLEQLEIVGKYSNGKDFEFIATSSSQIQKLYIVATAYKTDSIEKNKSRIENREQLREQRKKELKELIEKDKPTMKLYTREQMIEAFNYGQKLEKFDWIGDMIDSLEAIELPSDSLCINCDKSESTHNICMDCIIKIGKENIELPSDEEIVNKALEIQWSNTLFKDGAKWMRDKIKGGKK